MGSVRPIPYQGKNIAGITLYGYDDPEGIANGQLIARLSSEVVLAVYEALTNANELHLGRCASSEPLNAADYRDHACKARELVCAALALLDGLGGAT